MKIGFTGGGSGGHFYPIIAVAQQIRALADERKLVPPKLYYFGPRPYDRKALYENGIIFKYSSAGKMRRYFSVLNILDLFRTLIGVAQTLPQVFLAYPDVIFSKGGYASFPTVVAARLLKIPLLIHESDATPGRVNHLASKFARSVAVSYPETIGRFPKSNVALIGHPVRRELFNIGREGGRKYFELEEELPVVLILTGSQGALRINDAVIEALPRLVERYCILHQTGKRHVDAMRRTADVVLKDADKRARYKTFDFLDPLALRMAAGAADIVVSRAGSGTIFEVAIWGIPSIIVPIPEEVSHDQRRNAFAYARGGAASVLEEANLTPNVLVAEINRILSDESVRERMQKSAQQFAKPQAARKIAEEIIRIALEHEGN